MQASLLHELTPKRIAAKILKSLKLYHSVTKQKSDLVLEKINVILTAEGLIKEPLTRTDLSRLIDIHSPTAGGIRREEGFDPLTVLETCGAFNIQLVETYNHLSKMSGSHIFLKPYERLMKCMFPNDGATFFLIAEKVTE